MAACLKNPQHEHEGERGGRLAPRRAGD